MSDNFNAYFVEIVFFDKEAVKVQNTYVFVAKTPFFTPLKLGMKIGCVPKNTSDVFYRGFVQLVISSPGTIHTR